ncbi:MAG: hypothetical protein GY697_26095, partial [Desulfobacterales bacterium]|nr:hypothetical protein [Desulfobacterales bacterium]
MLIKEGKMALPNQNLVSIIPQRKLDEPSAVKAGGGSLKSGTGVHFELKGSPLAQPGGVSFSSSCTPVLSLGDPLEVKLEDRVNRSLITEGVKEGIEALRICTSLYPYT